MDPSQFDSLVRTLVVRPSRRRVLAAIAAALALPATTRAQNGGKSRRLPQGYEDA